MGKVVQGLIVEAIARKQGCKVMELAANKDIALACVTEDRNRKQVASLFDNIDALVLEGKLIEIEYCLPSSDRLKSFLLPANTEIKIKSGK